MISTKTLVIREKTSFTHLTLLRKFSAFNTLDISTQEYLVENSTIITIQSSKKTSQEFFLEDKMYILLEGKAFLSCIESSGNKVIIETLEEGSVFGTVDVTERNKQSIYIEPFPQSSIKLFELEKIDFLYILSKSPSLARHVFFNLSHRMIQLEQKIEELLFFDIETRLVKELKRIGKPVQEEQTTVEIEPAITHEKLAEMLGVVRETVSKKLIGLKRKGVVVGKKKSLIVRSDGKEKKRV